MNQSDQEEEYKKLIEMSDDEREELWPNLKRGTYEIKSEYTTDYNCIAWTINITDDWWYPNIFELTYWPPNFSRIPVLKTFIDTFQSLGFIICNTPNLEPEFEKVAIFVKKNNKVGHMAKQLPNGKWSSKLGRLEDIIHDDCNVLEGEFYGWVQQYLKKPKN